MEESIERLTDREAILLRAIQEINRINDRIRDVLRGSESEMFFAAMIQPSLYANMAAGLGGTSKFSYDPTWWKATNAITLALNEILPIYLPLKRVIIERAKNVPNEKLIEFNSMLVDLGKWIYIKKNENVTGIVIENGSAVKGLYQMQYQSLQEYVSANSKDPEEALWLDSFYTRMYQDNKFYTKLNLQFLDKYGFRVEDMANVSLHLEKLKTINDRILSKNGFRRFLQQNIRTRSTDNLLNSLIFQEHGNLEKSPLIPFEGGVLLVADWILTLHQLYDSYLRSILENYKIAGDYANLIGHTFENDLRTKISKSVSFARSQVIISEKQFPQINPYLRKMNKKDNFEIDVIASMNSHGFFISCKGGKKALPKLSFARKWAEYPENEIVARIEENREEMYEIELEVECVRNETVVANSLGMKNQEIHPILVYSSLQPLSFDVVKKEFRVNTSVPITTPERLIGVMKALAP